MDFLSGWCKSHRKLDGCTAIVTGSNTGIGKETVRDFYRRGARVIMACRDLKKAEAAKADLERRNNESTGTILVEKLDLSSLKSVREFARNILANEPTLSILVNNAGVMMCPQGKTEDGFEIHIGTNHFGHALLTLLLLPRLRKSAPARIVCVSSYLHKDYDFDFEDVNFDKIPYNAINAYSRSKAANVLFAKALANQLKEHNVEGVTTYSLHPGVIRTEISRHFSETAWRGATWFFNNVLGPFLLSPRGGAQTTVYCAVDEACENQTGMYYADCCVKAPSKQVQDEAAVSRFWDLTVDLLKLGNYDPFGELDPELDP